MKKYLGGCLAALLFAGWMTSPVSGQGTDEILEKMIEAMGGRRTLEDIEDMTIVAEVNMLELGLEARVTNFFKKPGLGRVDIELSGSVISQVFDGKRAWMVNPETEAKEQMPDEVQESAKRDSLGFFSLLNPEKSGIVFIFSGREKIGGKEYLVLEEEYEGGCKTTHYLDPETYLRFKSEGRVVDGMMMEVDEETLFSDYRRVGGVWIAHSIVVYQNGQMCLTSTVTSVKFNSGLEDSLFGKGSVVIHPRTASQTLLTDRSIK